MKNILKAIVMMVFLASTLTVVMADIPSVNGGRIEQIENFSSEFVPSRTISVWLPPGYDESHTYPVVYMHDGQMLFDATQTWNKQEWQVDEVASRLISEKLVKPFIVVGVANGGKYRHSEYFPQKPFLSLTEAQQTMLYNTDRSADTPLFASKVYSDNYLRFLVEELIPYIENHYPVGKNADDRKLLGSSMGGLISMYGLLEYPNVFSGAACLSTHWPGAFSSDNNPIPDAFIQYIDNNLPERGKVNIYFDYGTETLDAMYPPLQAKVDALMHSKGYSEPYWVTHKFEGAAHTETDWAKRLHIPITFLLGEK